MSKAITCINKRFAVKNSGISCLALIFSLSNLRTILPLAASACKKCVQAWVAKCDYSYHDAVFLGRSIRFHGSVLKPSCSESGDMGLILADCSNFLQP